MKFRPQVQFRFRSAEQFAAAKKEAEAFKSVNEMILLALEARYPGLGDAQIPESSEIGRKAVAAPKRVKAKAETPAKVSGLCSHGNDPKFCRLGECPGKRGK